MFVKNSKPIENCNLYQIRQFLIEVLTVKNCANSEKYIREKGKIKYESKHDYMIFKQI